MNMPKLTEVEIKQKRRQYYIDNKERIRQTQAEWRFRNQDKLEEYRGRKKEYYRQYSKNYQDKRYSDPESVEKLREYAREYYYKNTAKCRKHNRDYYFKNREYLKNYNRDRYIPIAKQSIETYYKQKEKAFDIGTYQKFNTGKFVVSFQLFSTS
eukprot:SAG11_NODE_2288_length_3561_cov_5.001155_4_plen_154_part_00